jgi:hypothetical protein
MIGISCNLYNFSQYVAAKPRIKTANASLHLENKTPAQGNLPVTAEKTGDGPAMYNNIRASIIQAKIDDSEKTAPAVREVPVDESYGGTRASWGIRALNNKDMIEGFEAETSTTERPVIYVEHIEDGVKRAYLVDINQIDMSDMTRLEALAMWKYTEINTYSEVPNDIGALFTMNELCVNFCDKNPIDHPDFAFPPLDEKINYFDVVKNEYLGNHVFSSEGVEAIRGYLTRLEGDSELTPSEKIIKIQKLIRSISDMLNVVNQKEDVAIRLEGISNLSRILGTDVKSKLSSWLSDSSQYKYYYMQEMEEYGALGMNSTTNNGDSAADNNIAQIAGSSVKQMLADWVGKRQSDELSAWDDFFAAREKRYDKAENLARA